LARAQTTFPGARGSALKALAAIILPASIDTNRVVERFIAWVRDYRPGADLEHGYGFPRFRSKPVLPVANYIRQLDELGATPNREAVERALAGVTALPQSPNGAHIVTDLMSFYFHSSDANDECYHAKIGRDQCRGLAGSDQPPAAR
jgi:hypothetical protein